MAALHPRSVRRLVVLSMAHPRRLRAGMTDPRAAAGVALRAALPGAPAARAHADPRRRRPGRRPDAALGRAGVGAHRATSPRPSTATGRPPASRRPRTARWSTTAGRPAPSCAPTACATPGGWPRRSPRPRCSCTASSTRACCRRTARGSGRYVAGAYEWRELPGIGHFPQEEAPDLVSAAIADWAIGDGPAGLASSSGGGASTRRGRCRPRRPRCCRRARPSATCGRGQRVAGVRVVDRRGEDDAQHACRRSRTAARRSCPARTLPYSA